VSEKAARTKFVASVTTQEGEKLSVRIGGRDHGRWIAVVSNRGERDGDGNPIPEVEYCEGNAFEPDDLPQIKAWLSRASAASPPPSIEDFVAALEDLLASPERYELMTEDQAFLFVWESDPSSPPRNPDSVIPETTETQMDLLDWTPKAKQPHRSPCPPACNET
jgi:hypothetical protein